MNIVLVRCFQLTHFMWTHLSAFDFYISRLSVSSPISFAVLFNVFARSYSCFPFFIIIILFLPNKNMQFTNIGISPSWDHRSKHFHTQNQNQKRKEKTLQTSSSSVNVDERKYPRNITARTHSNNFHIIKSVWMRLWREKDCVRERGQGSLYAGSTIFISLHISWAYFYDILFIRLFTFATHRHRHVPKAHVDSWASHIIMREFRIHMWLWLWRRQQNM